MGSGVRDLVRRLVRDESGQDLIEYALLTTSIGFAGILAWSLVGSAINGTYSSWVSATDSLAVPPAPTGGGS
jgi:Flp pilus assembly pilin Flp